VKNYKQWVDDFNTLYYYNGEVRLDSSVAAMGLIGSALVFAACFRRVRAYCASADQSADCK